jgi:hypothetical protein
VPTRSNPVDPTFAFIFAYLACHLAAYAVAFRWMRYFRTETGIFALHAASFLGLLGAVAANAQGAPDGPGLAAPRIALALSLHGIYSLSFLELWSLTQGSYSLSILDLVARSRDPVALGAVAPLHAIGPAKQSARSAALVSLRLLRPVGAGTELTPLGSLAARLVRALLWFSGGRPLNR